MGRRLVSFDWALKRLLRSKANFGILEGFLTELLGSAICVDELLESESNRDFDDQKSNRVDLKCRDASGRILLIELQHERQDDFLNRAVFGVSRALTEHLHAGETYGELPKVISINLVYFNLGQGTDYIYHGRTHFVGIHTHDELELSEAERTAYGASTVPEVMPEYYLLKINAFDHVAKNGLDEWMAFLKTQEVPDQPRGKGLREAKQVLDMLHLSDQERRAYNAYQDELHLRASLVDSHYGRGVREGQKQGIERGIERGIKRGLKQGLKQGVEAGRKQAAHAIATRLLGAHLNLEEVAAMTGLGVSELKALQKPQKTRKLRTKKVREPRGKLRWLADSLLRVVVRASVRRRHVSAPRRRAAGRARMEFVRHHHDSPRSRAHARAVAARCPIHHSFFRGCST